MVSVLGAYYNGHMRLHMCYCGERECVVRRVLEIETCGHM